MAPPLYIREMWASENLTVKRNEKKVNQLKMSEKICQKVEKVKKNEFRSNIKRDFSIFDFFIDSSNDFTLIKRSTYSSVHN